MDKIILTIPKYEMIPNILKTYDDKFFEKRNIMGLLILDFMVILKSDKFFIRDGYLHLSHSQYELIEELDKYEDNIIVGILYHIDIKWYYVNIKNYRIYLDSYTITRYINVIYNEKDIYIDMDKFIGILIFTDNNIISIQKRCIIIDEKYITFNKYIQIILQQKKIEMINKYCFLFDYGDEDFYNTVYINQ